MFWFPSATSEFSISFFIHSTLYFFFLGIVCVLVAQSCPTPCDPMDCSPSGSSVHGILQARVVEWVAIPFSRGSSWTRDQTQVSSLQADSLSSEPPGKPLEWNFVRRQFCPAAELGEGRRKPNGAGAPWEGGHLREAEPEVEGAIEPDNIPVPPGKFNSM